MTPFEQLFSLKAPHRFIALVKIGADRHIRYQVQTPDMIEAVDKTVDELLLDVWQHVPIQQLGSQYSLSVAVNHLRNEVARSTRRSVANVVILNNEDMFEKCEFHSAMHVAKIADDTLQPNEIRTALAMPAGMFDAFDSPFAFTPKGNFVNSTAVCGPYGYFARGFLND